MALRALVHAALVGALVGVGGPAQARGSLECYAEVPGVTARGVPTTFQYDDGQASAQTRGPGTLGYQPRDVAYPHDVGNGIGRGLTGSTSVTSHWFTLSG